LDGDVFTINFTTPAAGNFVNNQKLRMRVISDFDNGVNTIVNAHTTDIGNIEDYAVIFNPTLSVNDFGLESNLISIYPNPANSDVYIKNLTDKKVMAVTVFDYLGKQVLKTTKTDKISVDKLENGVYFLELKLNTKQTITKRFIKN
jgi:hypothetical protein